MKKICWILFLLSFSLRVSCQDAPHAFTIKDGTIIILTATPLLSSYFTIEKRLAGKEGFEPLTIVSNPKIESEFKGLVLNYSQYFYPIPFDSKQLSLIWKDFQENRLEKKAGVYLLHPAMWLAFGLACIDTSAKNGKVFEYKITLYKSGKAEWTKTIKTEISSQKKMITYTNSYKAITREKSILLEWHIPERDKPGYFDVFRSEAQKDNLQNIPSEKGFYTSKDSLVLISMDSMIAPNEIYSYYFQTYDFWGNPAGKTEPVILFARNMSDVPFLTDFTSVAIRKGVRIKWKYNDLKGASSISILRSRSFDTGFKRIAEVRFNDTAYLDETTIPATNYYYQLKLNFFNGQSLPSTRIAGYSASTPIPTPPRHFRVISLKNGIKLAWNGEEKWISGYIVYRAPGCKGKMTQVSPIIKPENLDTFTWTDVSFELKGNLVYSYTVKAISPTLESSPFSDTICVSPEGKTPPPQTPTRVRIRKEAKIAFITWDDLSVSEPLLLGYNIFRNGVSLYNSKDIQPDKLLNSTIMPYQHNFYTDTNIVSGYRYEYTVEAVNVLNMKSGLSFPAIVEIEEPAPVSPAAIHLYNTPDGIQIKWDGTSQDKLASYVVYRYEVDEKPKAIYTANRDESSFTDKTVKKDVLYFYYVTSLTTDGRESQPDAISSLRKN